MKNKDKIFDDIARVAGGTVNVFGGLTRNIKHDIKTRTDEAASRLDLVPREDFDRLEAVLKETRSIQEKQEQRLTALETALNKKQDA